MTTTEDDFIEDWKKGFEMAKQAAKSDDSNDFATTRGLYVEATEVLLTTQRKLSITDPCILQLLRYMIGRAETLSSHNSHTNLDNKHSCFVIEKISAFSTARAIYFDERGDKTNAYAWYMLAAIYSADLFQNYMPNNKSLKQNTMNIMDRVDLLKNYRRKKSISPLLNQSIKITLDPPTRQEIEVLKNTSTINSAVYLPFTESDEETQKYFDNDMYTDPMGMLPMSENQTKRFSSWKRPSEFISKPRIASFPSPYNIRQSVITNCSFVASLCVAAAYEKRFNMQLVTNLIYPQKSGKPVYNSNGKYLVKLHFNAVPRKVFIDDYIPVDTNNNLLCTHSTSLDLWPTLLEKAYMKLHGGYTFPGSNSAIDLHILTGWYPEQIVFNNKLDLNTVWTRVIDGWRLGACLITVSTGNNSAIRTGLSMEAVGLEANHAYAVLDVVETSCGKKLFQIKNPWMRKRWCGKYGPHDKVNWTTHLQQELNYDLLGALQQDNGVFWIDLESLTQYFAVMHLSWNPRLFNFRKTVHEQWDVRSRSPLTGLDHYTIGWNPQYKVRIFGASSFWVMLHKHWTTMEKRNDDFITFHIYSCTTNNGEHQSNFDRMVMDDEQRKIVTGRYINDPHIRVCITTPKVQTWHEYIIVVSQFRDLSNITFSLNVASSQECSLQVIPYLDQKLSGQVAMVKGEWNNRNCGGSCNETATYRNNPQYILHVEQPGTVRLWLDSNTDKSYLNIIVFRNNGQKITYAVDKLMVATSGNYRQSFCTCEFLAGPNEKFTVVCSTFKRDQYCQFSLWAEGKDIAVHLEPLL